MLTPPNSLEMIDALSASDARQDLTFFALSVLWNHNCNRLTNGLFGGVAEDTLGTPVPARDNAIEVLAYDRVVAGLDDGRQPTQPLFGFAQRCFDLLVLGNVAIDFEYGVAEQLHTAVNDDFAPVLTDMA